MKKKLIQPIAPRDEFAMAALNGFLTSASGELGFHFVSNFAMATEAYSVADAMMAVREKTCAKKGKK